MGGPGHKVLAAAIGTWRGIVGRRVANAAELQQCMGDLYAAIYATDFAAIDTAEVRQIAPVASDHLFDLYLTLRDRIPEWHAKGAMRDGAPLAVRNAMRVLRYTTDIIGEVAAGYPRLGPGETTHAVFAGPPSWTMMHPRLAEGAGVSFQAGDVILVRGQMHNSAAIARIGDADAQFSHVGMVHIDQDGSRWMVEALIEAGSVLRPLEAALSNGVGRAILFRHRDAALANRAAAYAADLVQSASRGLFGWLPYDFSMELDGDDRFFCSKLVRHGYIAASAGAMRFPSFPTRLSMTNRDFFERLGVTAVDTFAPADFEVEPAFDVVAEWRDYRVTSHLRMQDLLMSKLFEWMDSYGYRFRENLRMGVMALAGRGVSFGPELVKDLLVRGGLPKIPSNMNTRTIATIGMLHETAEPILQRLIALETDRIRTSGRPLHPREVQAELERFRAASGGRIGYLVAPDS